MASLQVSSKVHNVIWRCAVCEKWHTHRDQMYLVMMPTAFQMQGPNGQIGMSPVPVDLGCFKMLDLKEVPDAQIHLPSEKERQVIQKGL